MKTRQNNIDKEENERFYVSQYLTFRNHAVSKIETLSEFCPDFDKLRIQGPDIRANCKISGKIKSIGIELTFYHCRGGEHGSISTRLNNLRTKILDQVENWISQHPILREYHVCLHINENALPSKSQLPTFLSNCVDFVVSTLPLSSERETIHSARRRNAQTLPDSIKSYLNYISISHGCCGWSVSDACSIGANIKNLTDTIIAKSKKRQKYYQCDEKWLLICAAGDGADGSFGPPTVGQELRENLIVEECAEGSGFDKVICWESTRKWAVIFDIHDGKAKIDFHQSK